MPAERSTIVQLAECCEYRCSVAFESAARGRLESAQENLDWAELHAVTAFSCAERRMIPQVNASPASPSAFMAGPVLVVADTGDTFLNACRVGQHYLDLAELAFLAGRRDCGCVFLGRASAALEVVQ